MHEDGRRLALVGRLDASNVAEVRRALHDALDAGSGDLVVELAEVELADATGLGVLVGAHRRAGRASRRLVLADVPERTARLLLRSRLSRVLHVRARADVA